jgi:acylglycerol lipase
MGTPMIAAEFNVPIRIVHGDHDRVTKHTCSVDFVKTVPAGDSECEIYPGVEHAMTWVGEDEEDDRGRQKVLRDLEGWLAARV